MARDILKHWREYRPKMCKALAAKGTLFPIVEAAAEMTADALTTSLAKPHNLPYNQAWEMVREEWAFLPEEREVKTLLFDPETLPQTKAWAKSRSPPTRKAARNRKPGGPRRKSKRRWRSGSASRASSDIRTGNSRAPAKS